MMQELTQEEKDLILKDISNRLLYGVKAWVKNYCEFAWHEGIYTVKSCFPSLNEVHVQSDTGSLDVLLGYYDYEFKPYLLPISSMTKEQKKYVRSNHTFGATYELFDWLDKNHFDYRGLIDRGLAIDATGLNIY